MRARIGGRQLSGGKFDAKQICTNPRHMRDAVGRYGSTASRGRASIRSQLPIILGFFTELDDQLWPCVSRYRAGAHEFSRVHRPVRSMLPLRTRALAMQAEQGWSIRGLHVRRA